MTVGLLFCLFLSTDFVYSVPDESSSQVFIRVNQLGFLPRNHKTAILFSQQPLNAEVKLIDRQKGQTVFAAKPEEFKQKGWGNFNYYYRFDFSSIIAAGEYFIAAGNDTSFHFSINDSLYSGIPDILLEYMRQQRCGYNSFWDEVCHQHDGRTFFAPLPDSSFIDVSGGWHDAGDDLKYLLTASYATAVMLISYRLNPGIFSDRVDCLGQPYPNDIPDLLDEARWGLDWIHKLHPNSTNLYHQVADDRDHIGWKFPYRDSSDYGWGPESYRPVYYANGKPQGLGPFQSQSDGIANLAGRCAASMAMAYTIWKESLNDTVFADRCRRSALELYNIGKNNEGVQQGNSYGAPYRYGEITWADDMEWAAAELFRITQNESYLRDAIRYATMIQDLSWMGRDTASHYEYYPFLNVGHYSLHQIIHSSDRDILASYYREGIEKCIEKGKANPFQIGVPFIWCSNNLVTALVSQCALYEKMSGNDQFKNFMTLQRDWLFGLNPWGTSMFVGIPANGDYPEHPHASTYALTGRQITGGLVDGPVYGSIFKSLKGLYLSKVDEFAEFQTDYVVYHDDIADYSSNEPTMDGTAAAILMFTLLNMQK
ncbi:MAG: glycoside hydrolase family 9 [Calditrichaeota bacterium]|nr:glycoside hydrolase family 9 protein [Calditrichota bacterium]RQW07479.1 MAG: glycoside hydrolase family 9 [Calditrichota bacterium]